MISKEYARKHGIGLSEPDIAFEMSNLITDIRLSKGLTQTELARLMGTKQGNISRAESGKIEPSMSFIYRAAKAAGLEIELPKIAKHLPDTSL